MIQYKLYPEEKLIILQIIDGCNFNELMELIQTYMQDPGYSPDFNGVLDMRAGYLDLTQEEVAQIAQFVQQQRFAKGLWCHIVHDHRSTALGMVYEQLISDEHPLQVFSTVKAASGFMGVNLSRYLKGP